MELCVKGLNLKSRHESSHSTLWQNKSLKYKGHCVNNALCLKKYTWNSEMYGYEIY